jgi:hypothetical protein
LRVRFGFPHRRTARRHRDREHDVKKKPPVQRSRSNTGVSFGSIHGEDSFAGFHAG